MQMMEVWTQEKGTGLKNVRQWATPEAASTADETSHCEAKYEVYFLLCGIGSTNVCH